MKFHFIKSTAVAAFISWFTISCSSTKIASTSNETYLFVGTYTQEGSKGIYIYKMDTVTGKTRLVSDYAVADPSYLAISKNGRFVYAVTERASQDQSSVHALSFDKNSGLLSPINTVKAGGGAPCYIVIAPNGKQVITANYMGGSLSEYKINKDGSLAYEHTLSYSGKGFHPERQTQSHLHFGIFSPDTHYFYASDLGLDKIYKFKVNAAGKPFLIPGQPTSYSVKKGSGPRHMVFHPNGKFLYLITEISGDIDVFSYHKGNLTPIQTIKADVFHGEGSADIHITPNGKFLYASNRLKGDGLAIFSIDKTSGKLTKIGYQKTGIHPRSFGITPNGKFVVVASRDSDEIQIFKIEKNGLLTDTGHTIKLSMPVCIKFMPE